MQRDCAATRLRQLPAGIRPPNDSLSKRQPAYGTRPRLRSSRHAGETLAADGAPGDAARRMDAFGLPAENAARERRVDPALWTDSNIGEMKAQLRQLDVAFDWNLELRTSHRSYYRWTQWLFLQLFGSGLAYKATAEVNWDPADATVLADEQVDRGGRSWRSGSRVERRQLSQWFFRITAYVDRLLPQTNPDCRRQCSSGSATGLGRCRAARTISATGSSPDSDIGARPSRLSTATAVAQCRWTKTACHLSCRATFLFRWPSIPRGNSPPVRAVTGGPPGRRTLWTRSSTRHSTFCAF